MKAEGAFRNIGEVAAELDVKKHVLRFWEQKFPQLKPMKRGGGRRLYRPGDVQLLRGIRDLLQDAGYTIKGVQKILREDGIERVKVAGEGGPSGLDAGEAGRVVTYARADKLVRFSSMEVEALRAVAAELSACQALLLASTSSKAAGQHDKRVSRS